MNKLLLTGKFCLFLTIVLFSVSSYAQLPDFTVSATATPQTCLGNGALSLTVSGTNPSASIDYAVYLLPDTTTPVVITTSPTVNGLVAGDYLVVATQSLAGESNTASVNVTVANNVVQLAYTLVPSPVSCGNDGEIEVDVISGNAVSYEIIAGPVTKPLQASPIFTGLPAGQYQVRVHDNCGDAVVVTTQLFQGNSDVVIGPGNLAGGELPSCNTTFVINGLSEVPGFGIFLPLTLTYTVYPPGGGTPTTVVATGAPPFVTAEIPFYHDLQYSYDVTAVDACGNILDTRTNNIINGSISVLEMPQIPNCTDFAFFLEPSNYVGPFTVNFVSAPSGFVPENFNVQHPTFDQPEESLYGTPGNSVPLGNYTVEITDACGRTATRTFELVIPEATPQVIGQVIDCFTGTIDIEIPGRNIVSIFITSAPPEYPGPFPADVTPFISDGGLFLPDVPVGDYTFEFTDDCGVTYEEDVELNAGNSMQLLAQQRAGCAVGEGSLRLRDASSELVTVIITAAPAAFTEPLPFDVSSTLTSNGNLYMNGLPEGTYTFSCVNTCGGTGTTDVDIVGYEKTVNSFELTENCGSFDLLIENASNGNYIQTFWLQKYNPDTNTWGHPLTDVPYTEGEQPNNSNSVPLVNNNTNYSLGYSGQFRVIKIFFVYNNGSSANFRCVDVMHEFSVLSGPQIEDVFSFPCGGETIEVAIDATGLAPLNYSIIQMNSEPFDFDNGTSNMFSGLTAGTYTFRVTDACSNFRNVQVDITELDPMEIEATSLCDGEDGQLFVSNFSFLNYEWWEESAPATILSTESSLDFLSFNSATDAGTYYVRIYTDNPVSCIDQTISFTISPNMNANAGEDNNINYCNDGEDIDLAEYLSEPYDEDGIWTDVTGSGAFTGSILTTEGLAAGTYEFTYFVTGMCDTTDEAVITVTVNDIPQAPTAAPVAAVCEGENIQLSASEVQGATYQWSGPDGFTSAEQNPLIEGAGLLNSGTYQVMVLVNECASPTASVDVTVNALPDFTLGGNTLLCEGQAGIISVTPANFDEEAVTYQWYFDDILLDGVDAPDVEVSEPGVYSVEINSNGCLREESITVNENINAFEVTLENGCIDFEYVISITNTDELEGASYDWTGPEGFTATGEEIVITEGVAGTYTVEVTAADGCTATAFVEVDNTYCKIPRGISPGDADINNNFDLSNLDAKNLQIFNRYGLKVYEKDNYKNEWYGQSDSGELPTGTYYYVVTLSAGKRVSGWVYLQRMVD